MESVVEITRGLMELRIFTALDRHSLLDNSYLSGSMNFVSEAELGIAYW